MTENEQLIQQTVRDFAKLVVEAAMLEDDRPSLEHIEEIFFLEMARGFKKRGLGLQTIADIFGTTKRTIHRRLKRAEERSNEESQTFHRLVSAFVHEQTETTREEILKAFPTLTPEACASLLNDLRRTEKISVEKGVITWIGQFETDGYVTDEVTRYVTLAQFLLCYTTSSFDDVLDRYPVSDSVRESARTTLIERGMLDEDGNRPEEILLNMPQHRFQALSHSISQFVRATISAMRDDEVAKGWLYLIAMPPDADTRDTPLSIYQKSLEFVKSQWAEYVETTPETRTPTGPGTHHFVMGMYFSERPFDPDTE